ncbi:citramalate synthase [Magnetovibrio blakemorei]|uniref:Citramalate synthase n=1 Tax=Magnetovibrio blakemorei TaxID=28181 RepID=A0A1E5Q8M6_9PROT|nr:citramalate synthase [Magnetovibrio blakemorei]OEJ67606.1 citramalate synthase [Magnetovibrio blakemorei]
MSAPRVYIYDTTLRDGAQTSGVDFGPADKDAIARELDALGVDYIEGGWPGANPTDDSFFDNLPPVSRARITAFGMTRRAGRSADNDPGLNALLSTDARVVCMVGKTWDYHVDVALGIERTENIAMIKDSIAYAVTRVDEVLFDAEHFFDGYKANPEFAMSCLKAAIDGGARWVVLCDTNGGTMPFEIDDIVTQVCKTIPGDKIGIHCHDDTGNAVANSLSAVRAGARMVQGTINGLGERCGNANLVSVIPSLMLKMGYDTNVGEAGLKRLRHVSNGLDERLNRAPDRHRPYVGESAFAHKGGLHVSAVEKDPRCYEHVPPASVGNHRQILISDQAGRSNILARFREIGIDIDDKDPRIMTLLDKVKEKEKQGFSYDGAGASFELLARRILGDVPDYFHCSSFRVIDERRWNAKDERVTLSEATVKLALHGDAANAKDGAQRMAVAEGNGPVNALDAAMRKVLLPLYPTLKDLRLVDYKVRILTPGDATAAVTRVMIESTDASGRTWATVGVSANVIDASYNALRDSIVFKLLQDGVAAA